MPDPLRVGAAGVRHRDGATADTSSRSSGSPSGDEHRGRGVVDGDDDGGRTVGWSCCRRRPSPGRAGCSRRRATRRSCSMRGRAIGVVVASTQVTPPLDRSSYCSFVGRERWLRRRPRRSSSPCRGPRRRRPGTSAAVSVGAVLSTVDVDRIRSRPGCRVHPASSGTRPSRRRSGGRDPVQWASQPVRPASSSVGPRRVALQHDRRDAEPAPSVAVREADSRTCRALGRTTGRRGDRRRGVSTLSNVSVRTELVCVLPALRSRAAAACSRRRRAARSTAVPRCRRERAVGRTGDDGPRPPTAAGARTLPTPDRDVPVARRR